MHVTTVTGDISPEDAGITLPHEHVIVDLLCYYEKPKDARERELAKQKVRLSNLGELRKNPTVVEDNMVLTSARDATEELKLFKKGGGSTVVDVTPDGIGRNPRTLRKISEESGVNIVAGSGYYVGLSHPSYLKKWNVDRIAQEIVKDLTQGIGDTGIRAGIIGEVGVLVDEPTEAEKKSLRAAAKAQSETGAGLLIHSTVSLKAPSRALDILEAAGADLTKVVISHRDAVIKHSSKEERTKHYSSIADRGAYVEFDCFGEEYYFPKIGDFLNYSQPKDVERVAEIVDLVNLGYTSKLLLSQDVCFKMYLKKYGGYGWEHIPVRVVPLMEDAGLNKSQIHAMLVENTKNVLSF